MRSARLTSSVAWTGPAVHTRSAGPVPAISLSTELPELPLSVEAEPEQQLLGQDTPEPKGTPATTAAEQEQETIEAMALSKHNTAEGHGGMRL